MKLHREIDVSLIDKNIVMSVDGDDVMEVEFNDIISASKQYKKLVEDVNTCSPDLKELLESQNIVHHNDINSGSWFMSRMQLLTEFKYLKEKGESELTKMIFDESDHHELVKDFTLQYYHVTNMCRSSIAASIATLKGKQKQLAIDFFEEEIGHEKLLKRALQAIGVSDFSDRSILPSTRALMNRLRYCSIIDPLSFMAIIFLYEGSTEDGRDYINSLRRHEFDNDFINPQEKHEDINSNGEHDKVSLSFYEELSFINNSDSVRVEQMIKDTIDIEYYMHSEIVDNYEKNRKLY